MQISRVLKMGIRLLVASCCAFLLLLTAKTQDKAGNAGQADAGQPDSREQSPAQGESASLKTSSGEPVYRVGVGVRPPRALNAPNPEYTDAAKKAKIEGTVLLRLIINAQGLPEHVRVEKSLDPGLDQSAVEAIERWTFAPATKDGKPVPVLINVKLNFSLAKANGGGPPGQPAPVK
jgi:TonB family protein